MKPRAALIHVAALAACFAAHMAFASEFEGVRRAMQTMAATKGLPAAEFCLAAG